jgi:predicted enzyme related to lactoylglutathione lyase
MKRAVDFYRGLLAIDVHEMKLGNNDYALFAVKDKFNSGCLVKGDGYIPRTDGVVVYLNGGNDLSGVLKRVEKSGGEVLMPKTFLSKEAGHIAFFKDTEGNKIGLHSTN